MPTLVLKIPLGSEEYLSYVVLKLRMWGFCKEVLCVRVRVYMCVPVCACTRVCTHVYPCACTCIVCSCVRAPSLWEGEVEGANCTARAFNYRVLKGGS